jgi:hypothetical protein
VAFSAGSLDLTTMNLLEKAFVLLVVGATPGDGHSWKAMREWGAGRVVASYRPDRRRDYLIR